MDSLFEVNLAGGECSVDGVDPNFKSCLPFYFATLMQYADLPDPGVHSC